MKFKTVALMTATIFGSSLAAPATAAELITNGSFSAGLTGWYLTALPATDVIVTPGQPYTGIGGTGSLTSLSNPFADFGGGNEPNVSTLSQTFNTVADATYFLSFSAGAFGPSGGLQTFTYSVTGSPSGTATVTNDNNFDTTFKTFGQSFVALGGPTTVSFTLAGNTSINQDGFLDNVSVTGPVPEPATWAMMLMGFGMVGVGLRSRRKPTVRLTYA